ncbi:MAG: MBL fold metallo-hydrolase [Coriobacteriales bacterium]|jgi:phosphoribosyl 1,2-cyclic phosphate phosphodiesterase|nr:MBL fold metallo-hydrolase [Coriobacteriales bacterium]
MSVSRSKNENAVADAPVSSLYEEADCCLNQSKNESNVAEVIVLGTGTTVGVPAFYCDCVACREAHANVLAQRTCPGIAIKATNGSVTLIDASPDLRSQLVREGITAINQVLLTHEHYDHVGGLPHLEFYIKLARRDRLPVYTNEQTANILVQQYAFMLDCLEIHIINAEDTLRFDDVSYTALKAKHSVGAFGFLLQTEKKSLAYFPDTAKLPDATIKHLLNMRPLDALLIDATFNGKNWMPDSHNNIASAIATAEELAAKKTWLTHLAMHYDTPITTTSLNALLDQYCDRIRIAYDGLRIAI